MKKVSNRKIPFGVRRRLEKMSDMIADIVNQVNALVDDFFHTYDDQLMLDTFVGVANDIIDPNNAVAPNERITATHVIGDLRAIPGWWNSQEIYKELFAVLDSRALRAFLEVRHGVDVQSLPPHVAAEVIRPFDKRMDEQRDRLYDKIVSILNSQYGSIVPDPTLVAAFVEKERAFAEQFIKDPLTTIATLDAINESDNAQKH